MSLKASHPINRIGVTTRRFAQWRATQRKIASARSLGSCEAGTCPQRSVDVHHAFARRQILSIGFADHNAWLVALCRQHHSQVHSEPGCPTECDLMCKALLRAVREWNLPLVIPLENRKAYIAAARELERLLREDAETWQALLQEAGR